jgi:hypothetical protein
MPHDANLYAAGVKGTTPAAIRAALEATVDEAQAEYQSSADASLEQFQGRLDLEELPTISAIDPTSLSAGPGGSVTINVTGNGFTGTTSVKLGAVAASSVTITDDLHIVAVFPKPLATASLNVVVHKGDHASNAAVYAFTLTA